MTTGWPEFALGGLCHVASGGTPPRGVTANFDGDVPWVKIGDMLQDPITKTDECISQKALGASSAKVFPAGTVLLSIFATVGRTAVLGVPAATNQAIAGIIPMDSSGLDARFLRRYLDHSISALQSQSRGAAQANINLSILRRLPIPMPPIDEQRRIAAILDQADELRAKRRAALAHLDSLTRSIFLDMFGDTVSNSAGWSENRTLGDIADIRSGVTKGRPVSGPLLEVPYLAVANVQDRHLQLDTVKTIAVTAEEIEKFRLQQSDLLLTEGGDPDKLGRGALWGGEIRDCIHQNHIFRVRLTSSEVLPLFLSWLIGTQRGKRYFLRSAKQTTGIASINLSQLRAFPMLIPPLDLQHVFEHRVLAVAKVRASASTGSGDLNALFASLQQRAFSGAL